ncbi:MAG: class I SAM-dependent methyltransferase [Chloroflexi bacterium]|nr:MAG: class I SAM-dependent methyltransferase [Chloroflexota bacterium]
MPGKGSIFMSNNPYSSPQWEQHHILPHAYTFHPYDENEVTRLLLRHRQLSECMGGILPASLDLTQVKRVLDANCGVGGWVYDLAWRYPSMQVMGFDGDSFFVEQAQAFVAGLGNAVVIEQDIHHLSDEVLPPASFDVVHARFLVSDVLPQEYPAVIPSLVRLCRAGGMFVWEEIEFPITNSRACQQIFTVVQNGLKALGRAFVPGHALGITVLMGSWLRASGCKIVVDKAYSIDVSAGTKGHEAFARQMWVFGKQISSLLLESHVTTAEAFEELCKQAQQEIVNAGFCGICYLRTLVGVR